MTCKLCGREITETKKAWREHIGWVTPKGAKGMTGAHNTGALAHPECITLLRAKIGIEQTNLLESGEPPE